MNKNLKKILLILILLFPGMVFATNQNSNVLHSENENSNVYTCTSKFQDKSVLINGDTYFSHCMEARCEDNKYNLYYKSPANKVYCNNGNQDPYAEITKTGCNNVNNRVCYGKQVKYCSIIVYYDCNRKSNGNAFTTTTTTTKTTKRTTNSTTRKTTKKTTIKSTTTSTTKSNTKLKSLALSSGSINFNPNTYEYNINLDKDVNTITINAIPEDSKSKVVVTDNTNLENGSVIKVTVTGADKSTSIYKIKVSKEVYIMSNNAKLKSLSIEGYTISFNPKIYEYPLYVDRDTKTLRINYETDDEKSTVEVNGNNNIIDGGKVSVKVTAEDGTENEYIINITLKKKSNSFKIIFIIILILALLAGAYYVYKKIIQGKSSEKYEYE